jgi:hypothetical protein
MPTMSDSPSTQSPVHELIYGQSWQPELDPRFNPGKVILQRCGDTLELKAILTDNEIHDPRAEFNEYAYTKGDVFELFLKAEGDDVYHEIHVTPSNVLLQLRFSVNEPLNVDKAKVWEPLLNSSVERFEGGWIARYSLPLGNVTQLRPIPTRWKFGCGRYDYNPNAPEGTRPTISNTAPLTVANFHRHGEWTLLDLGQG